MADFGPKGGVNIGSPFGGGAGGLGGLTSGANQLFAMLLASSQRRKSQAALFEREQRSERRMAARSEVAYERAIEGEVRRDQLQEQARLRTEARQKADYAAVGEGMDEAREMLAQANAEKRGPAVTQQYPAGASITGYAALNSFEKKALLMDRRPQYAEQTEGGPKKLSAAGEALYKQLEGNEPITYLSPLNRDKLLGEVGDHFTAKFKDRPDLAMAVVEGLKGEMHDAYGGLPDRRGAIKNLHDRVSADVRLLAPATQSTLTGSLFGTRKSTVDVSTRAAMEGFDRTRFASGMKLDISRIASINPEAAREFKDVELAEFNSGGYTANFELDENGDPFAISVSGPNEEWARRLTSWLGGNPALTNRTIGLLVTGGTKDADIEAIGAEMRGQGASPTEMQPTHGEKRQLAPIDSPTIETLRRNVLRLWPDEGE